MLDETFIGAGMLQNVSTLEVHGWGWLMAAVGGHRGGGGHGVIAENCCSRLTDWWL